MPQAFTKVILSRWFIGFEFALMCVALPTYIIVTKSAPFMFAFLYGAALYCTIILLTFYKDHWRDLWKFREVNWPNLKPLLVRWFFASIGMLAFMAWYDPERLFRLWHEHPGFIPLLLLAYPVLSALPQELIFCSFFFERYKPFFGAGKRMIAASAIIFAYAHIIYINPVAPTLSLLGGLIFALTYVRTKSLALVTIEHGLYGNVLFVIGLGWYFYGGSVLEQ